MDAGTVVAIVLEEPESQGLMKAMEAAGGNLRFSPTVRVEATLAVMLLRIEGRGKGPATA